MSNVRRTKMLQCRFIRRLVAVATLALSQAVFAAEAKLGLSIGVDGEGFVFNPVVNRISVTGVAPNSLAAQAGIVAGDEITSIEGQLVKGKRANDLKAYLNFSPGEARTLELKRQNGEPYQAKLTKPKL